VLLPYHRMVVENELILHCEDVDAELLSSQRLSMGPVREFHGSHGSRCPHNVSGSWKLWRSWFSPLMNERHRYGRVDPSVDKLIQFGIRLDRPIDPDDIVQLGGHP
jgi:hypothetical protein